MGDIVTGKFQGHGPNQESWPTPLEMLDLQDAVSKGKERVKLSGIDFEIFYKEDHIYVSPVKGFTPCGTFDLPLSFVM